jgi:hypothetical protein
MSKRKSNRFGREPLSGILQISQLSPKNVIVKHAPLDSDLTLARNIVKNKNFVKNYVDRMSNIIKVTVPISKSSALIKKLSDYSYQFPAYCKFHSDNAGDVVPIIDDRFSGNEGLDVWAAVLFPVSLQIWDDMEHPV